MTKRELKTFIYLYICVGRTTKYGEGFTSQKYDLSIKGENSADDKDKLKNPRDDNFEVINIDDNEGLFTEIKDESEG